MNALTSTIIAMICYSVANWMMEEKFAKFDSLTVIVGYSSIIFFTMLTLRTFFLKSSELSTGNSFSQLPLIPLLVMGLIFAAADFFYIGAYSKGASATTITGILILIPVLVTAIKYAGSGSV